MKRFNTRGICYPNKHYMVDIHNRLDDIVNLITNGEYVTINRGRQYGKTTTLYHLAKRLSEDFFVFSISFEEFNGEDFRTEDTLAYSLLDAIQVFMDENPDLAADDAVRAMVDSKLESCREKREIFKNDFSKFITELCRTSSKPIVLIIDEVDNASNYETFIKLLGMLRGKYLKREEVPTFQSVILAGVYDIKNLKLKTRPESEHQYNSPWNIAMAFTEDMSLHTDGIEKMLQDYESDHHTGMDTAAVAQLITDYTSGYPFFVSRVCQLIDEQKFTWNKEGVMLAVKMLLKEKNTFFDDLNKKLDDFPEIKSILKDILYYGRSVAFNIDIKVLNIAAMFNYIKNVNDKVVVSNRIIETRLYNRFMSEEDLKNSIYGAGDTDRSQFIDGKTLKMDKILEKFAQHFNDIYGGNDLIFKEEECRRFFMLYVRPIINGSGNYYIEAQTRDRSRTDMIIDYLGTQYVIEMKIWRGNSYNERGEAQLAEYLDFYHITKGYLLSFCFNKKKAKPTAKTIAIGGKEIVEVVV